MIHMGGAVVSSVRRLIPLATECTESSPGIARPGLCSKRGRPTPVNPAVMGSYFVAEQERCGKQWQTTTWSRCLKNRGLTSLVLLRSNTAKEILALLCFFVSVFYCMSSCISVFVFLCLRMRVAPLSVHWRLHLAECYFLLGGKQCMSSWEVLFEVGFSWHIAGPPLGDQGPGRYFLNLIKRLIIMLWHLRRKELIMVTGEIRLHFLLLV